MTQDLLELMLPPRYKGVKTLQEYLRLTDEQWKLMQTASPEVQLIYRAKIRPQTDDELYDYIKFVFGITFPRTCHPDCAKKEVPCTPPFKVFADAFFARYPLIILKGSRGSGKSVLLGLLAITEQVCLDAEVLILGGSEEQAKVVFKYISQKKSRFRDLFWNSEFAPKALQDKANEQATMSQISSGGLIRCLPASETSIYGQRPQRLRIDECDKVKIDLIEGSIPCCHPNPEGTIANQIILSSTHYSAKGTLTEYIDRADRANRAAGKIVMPVYSFCYKDVLFENGGYITPKLMQDMKNSVNRHTWERQFENGEPAVEDAVFTDEDLDFLIDPSLGGLISEEEKETKGFLKTEDELSHQYWEAPDDVFDKEDYWAGCYVGCDFGDKVDWTVISQFKCPEDESKPDIMVRWVRSGRCGLTLSTKRYDKVITSEEMSAAHDATGASQYVAEVLTEYSEPITWNKIWKHEALNAFITAVERQRIKIPNITGLAKTLRYLTYEECFGNKHLPDEVASLILAWWARRKVMRSFNIGSVKW